MNVHSNPNPPAFSAIHQAIQTDTLPDLGPRVRPGVLSVGELTSRLEAVFKSQRISQPAQPLVRAATFLWHDHLDEAHVLVQDEHSTDAAFIHGIMHRREPDYSNAKYWFHRVGRHETFSLIASHAAEILAKESNPALTSLVEGRKWNPMKFIDACEEIASNPANEPQRLLLQQIQQIEFEVLLRHICP
ncbi:MAG: hypothetical protein EXS31_00400 [Pedosphaera sp.]|nr:hypothetical protein [Pedosphaera sp.]